MLEREAEAADLGSPENIETSPAEACRWELSDGVFTIEVTRPERRNAMTPEMYDAVRKGFIYAGSRSDVDVVVLSGTPGAFAVGGDLSVFLGLIEGGPEAFRATFEAAYDETLPFAAMLRCPHPVIAKIDGLCLAGGTLLAAAADIAVATERSTFGIPEGRIGLADAICCTLLPAVVGLSRARYLLLTGDTIDAQTAADWGLVLRVVAGDELDDAVDRIVTSIKKNAPSSRTLYKRELNREITVPSAQMLMDSATHPNAQEGLSAFVERRRPNWRQA